MPIRYLLIPIAAFIFSSCEKGQTEMSQKEESGIRELIHRPREKTGVHKIVKNIFPCVAVVRSPDGDLGTGFMFRADGYLLTNYHIVEENTSARVQFSDMREFDATVVGVDKQSDVALLKVPTNNAPFIPKGDSSLIEPGETVIVVGIPKGFAQTVTLGIVSAVGRADSSAYIKGENDDSPEDDEKKIRNFIQTDAAINRGNSGGPMVNSLGEVIGIVSAKLIAQDVEGVGFAIPINQAVGLAEQLIEYGDIKRGTLGITVDELSFTSRIGLGVPAEIDGVHVTQVIRGGASENVLALDDVIIRFFGDKIGSVGSLRATAGGLRAGTEVEVVVFRKGREQVLTLTLGGDEEEEEESDDNETDIEKDDSEAGETD